MLMLDVVSQVGPRVEPLVLCLPHVGGPSGCWGDGLWGISLRGGWIRRTDPLEHCREVPARHQHMAATGTDEHDPQRPG